MVGAETFVVIGLRKTLFELPRGGCDDDAVGQVLAGRYRLLRRLGAGQMARVYVAEQIAMERNVAIKLLHADLQLDHNAVQRFRQEIRIAARLRSPHTITCYDAGEAEQGTQFVAMELLAGETLRQRLDRGPIDPAEVVAIVSQIGESLLEAHEAGIVHRDLKPENVYLCSHPTPTRPFVKVLDFGLAKMMDAGVDSPRLTAERQTVGTPAYMAPEQIVRGRAVDHRADIYALAVMSFEMLTGVRPYRAKTVMKMVLAHVNEPIPSAAAIAAALPAEVDDFFQRVMAKRADDRPGRATELAPLLAAALT